MINIKQLKKVRDIINAEGTILGLYKQPSGNFFLSSYLKDNSGEVFYATNQDLLKQYFTSKITLKQVYLNSDDFFVTRKFRNETASFIKEDLAELIQCGDQLFNEISSSMRNNELANDFFVD
jgi:hypothetical protein